MAGPLLLTALGLACALRVMAVIKIRNARKKAKDHPGASQPASEENPPATKEIPSARSQPVEKDFENEPKMVQMKEKKNVDSSSLPRLQPKTYPLGDSTNYKTEVCSDKRSLTSSANDSSFLPHYIVHNLSVEVKSPAAFLSRKVDHHSHSLSPRILTRRKTGARDSRKSFLVIPLDSTTSRPQTRHSQLPPEPPAPDQFPNQRPNQHPSHAKPSPAWSPNLHQRHIQTCAWCGADQEDFCCGFGIFS